MDKLVVALDPSVELSPAELAGAWDADQEARAMGAATVTAPTREAYLPDVLALVVIPLLVNVASNVVCDLVARLIAKLRPPHPGQADLELVEVAGRDGDRIIVVRFRAADP